MDYFLIFIVYGIVLSVVLAFASFWDLLDVIIKAVQNKKVEGYEKYKRLKTSIEYKSHKRKWATVMSFVSAMGYTVSYIIIYLLIKNIAVSFCISLFVSLLCASRLKSKETQERKKIENKIEHNIGDTSLSSDEK